MVQRDMNPKATKYMAQMANKDFLIEVSKGLNIVLENVDALAADAQLLCDQKRPRGGRILLALAEEEAAKILILLDAVRCARKTEANQQNFSRQLWAFNDHMAKGIYVEYVDYRPTSFGEVEGYVPSMRAELYIDGSDYEVWINRNTILQEREDLIYVSYMRSGTKQFWNSPAFYPRDIAQLDCDASKSTILDLVRAIRRCGFFSEAGLEEIARIWQPAEMTKGFDIHEIEKLNRETLENLEKAGLFEGGSKEDVALIIDRWLFPLYPLELTPKPVKLADMDKLKKEAEDRIIEQLY